MNRFSGTSSCSLYLAKSIDEPSMMYRGLRYTIHAMTPGVLIVEPIKMSTLHLATMPGLGFFHGSRWKLPQLPRRFPPPSWKLLNKCGSFNKSSGGFHASS